ncbi:Fe2+-dependent dioxygenase [Sphingosinicella ginsenosidimutans]|uniref:Fe2+-dependent dioxygenase n=1 Tax=Allosphingosinicella ginsenosidimutans TaxID=1176539 RepID=A0A5C6TWX1_9SPHN|nr:Fe2+-dependent dioxygenase [Sphingosinicella ginsenosidimutans]TXC64973.1 Fe2+-dependent dioxygenase [Sphingosinicella ginsenosidimutans]
MMLAIPDLLDADAVARVRAVVDAGDWVDGNATSGHQSALAKKNMQLPEDSPAAREAGRIVLDALGRSPLFIAAALPLKIFPPLFNRYAGGDRFGTHVDNAVRIHRASEFRVRSDLSATLFLEDPAAYDGGELVVEDILGVHKVKLPAGHLILYPASSLHRVEPVTRGARVASFFWIQSMVRDDAARTILFDLDRSIQAIAAERGQDDAEIIRLTGVYHNLLRRWADS